MRPMFFEYSDLLECGYDVPYESYNKHIFECERLLDNATTCVDGYHKLRSAFPEDEFDRQAVCECICRLLTIKHEIDEAENRLKMLKSVSVGEDGMVRGKAVASVSAGSESISFMSGGNVGNTCYDAVLTDKNAQRHLMYDTIREILGAVTDKNGVNLLYVGAYPYV